MKPSIKTALLPLALSFFTAPALAAPSVMVSNCWVRALPGDLPSGGYFSVMNMSGKAINLVADLLDFQGSLSRDFARDSDGPIAAIKDAGHELVV